MGKPSLRLYKKVAVIDPSRCVGCVRCVRACSLKAIVGEPRRVPVVNEGLCIGCGICVEACPFNAISLSTRISVLPVAIAVVVAALALAAAYGVFLGAPEASMAPERNVTVEPVEAPVVPTAGPQVSIEYYHALEEEAGTEGG